LQDLTVAVKKLFAESNAVGEIATEVYVKKAKELKHDNILKLLYVYSRRHLHLLIYEFMEVGSLGQVLFGNFLYLSVSIHFGIYLYFASNLVNMNSKYTRKDKNKVFIHKVMVH
jgi:hypothetical protein